MKPGSFPSSSSTGPMRQDAITPSSSADIPRQGSAVAQEGEPHFLAACENILQHLGADSDRHAVHELPVRRSGHHDVGRLEQILKKLPGISEIDDPFHAVLGAKPVFTEAGVQLHQPKSADDTHHRLVEFQKGALPHSTVDLAADMLLTSVMMGAGVTAYFAGRQEAKHAKKEKKNLLQKRDAIEEKRRALLVALQSAGQPRSGETATEAKLRMHRMKLLTPEVAILDWELERIAVQLGHKGKEKAVGDGSAAAGLVSMIKGTVDIVTKPLGHFLESGASAAAASATGFFALPAAPLAAASGLYMGVNSKKLSQAQLREHKQKLRAALDEIGLIEKSLPADVQGDFRRFFSEGKWDSRTQQVTSFNKLMTWFVTGMSGYTAGMTGLSVAKIVALLAASAVVADLAISGGVLAATSVLMIGTYGFLRHRSRLHEQDKLVDSDSPEFDRQFMLRLFADGSVQGILQSVGVLRFIEGKEDRRQQFLHALAAQAGLRFDGVRTYSTDTGEVRAKKEEWKKEAGRNQTSRFLATHGMSSKNLHAIGKAAKGFVATVGDGGGLRSAGKQAGRDFAASVDYLTRTRLAALLESPAHFSTVAGYMLEEVNAQLDFLGDRLQKKIEMYDVPPGGEVILTAHLPSGEVPAAEDGEMHVKAHLHDIAMDLLGDKVLHAQAAALRRDLEQLSTASPPSAQERGILCMRFMDLQQWKVRDPAADDGNDAHDAAKSWARYLMDDAVREYKESRGRLHMTVLDAAPLHAAAGMLSGLKVRGFTHGWEWYRTATGAPQIGKLPYETLSLADEAAAVKRIKYGMEEPPRP